MNLPGSRNSDTAGVIIKVIIASVFGSTCCLACPLKIERIRTIGSLLTQLQGEV